MFKLLTVSAALVLQQTAPPAPAPPAAPQTAGLQPVAASAASPSAIFGLAVQDDSPFLGVVLGSRDGAIVIDEVVEGTAAEAAGLLAGDILAMAGGIRIEGSGDLTEAIAETGAGGTLKLVVQRGGQAVKLVAVLGTRDQPILESAPAPAPAPPAPAPSGRPFLGVNLGDADSGALVTSAVDGTAAARGGLLAGDLIVRYDDSPIRSADDLIDAVGGSRVGDEVRLVVERDGDRLVFELELGARIADTAPAPSAGAFRADPGTPEGEWDQWAEEFDEDDWEAWAEAFEQDMDAWAEELGEDWEAQVETGQWDSRNDWSDYDDRGDHGDEWEAWAQHWADDMGRWVEQDFDAMADGMDVFGDDMEAFGEHFEHQFERFGEHLEEAFEGFEDDFGSSMEEFAHRMEMHAERMAEQLQHRSRSMGQDFEQRLQSAPRGHGRQTDELQRHVVELTEALDRSRVERDEAMHRVHQLESELAGVRSEVSELRDEVRALIGVLEQLRSDN